MKQTSVIVRLFCLVLCLAVFFGLSGIIKEEQKEVKPALLTKTKGTFFSKSVVAEKKPEVLNAVIPGRMELEKDPKAKKHPGDKKI